MSVVTSLSRRWRPLAKEIAKFGAVGGVVTIFDFLIFNLLMLAGLPALKSNVVSTVAATTASYAMNRRWTYKGRSGRAMRREYTLFFAFNAAGMAIQLAVLGLVKYGFGAVEGHHWLALNLAKAFAIGIAMVFRFWAYRTFVFVTAPVVAGIAPANPAAAAAAAANPMAAEHDFDIEFAELTGPLEAEVDQPDEALRP